MEFIQVAKVINNGTFQFIDTRYSSYVYKYEQCRSKPYFKICTYIATYATTHYNILSNNEKITYSYSRSLIWFAICMHCIIHMTNHIILFILSWCMGTSKIKTGSTGSIVEQNSALKQSMSLG